LRPLDIEEDVTGTDEVASNQLGKRTDATMQWGERKIERLNRKVINLNFCCFATQIFLLLSVLLPLFIGKFNCFYSPTLIIALF